VFVAVAEVDHDLSPYQSIEILPPARLASLKAYIQVKAQEELRQTTGEVQWCDADTAAQLIRQTRLFLKRKQRMQPKGPAIAWFLPLFTRLRLLLSGPYRM
jgi:hypothetical protein